MEYFALIFSIVFWSLITAKRRIDNFDLTTRLYKSVNAEKDFVIAVAAVEQALCEIYAAAGDKSLTRNQISSLGFSNRSSNYVELHAKILKKLPQSVGGLKFGVIIALDRKYDMSSWYKRFLGTYFQQQIRSPVIRGDFARQADETLSKINDYISEATAGQIRKFLPPGFINRDTAIVMANSVLIKAKWRTGFPLIRQKTFHSFKNKQFPVDMFIDISKGENYYYEDERVECLKLSTEYAGVGMYILLPKKAASIQEFKVFGQSNYIRNIIYRPDGLTNNTSDYVLYMSIPRFEIRQTFDLKRSLEKIGFTAPFDISHADFSKLLDKPRNSFHISQMLQTAHIKVDEKGFEAAGAVAFDVTDRTGPQKPVKHFVADKPFHFYVTYASHQRSSMRFETVVFSGQYIGVSQ
uniref:Serpin domain-containing protein n=1 Tax=Romanomermis culicivorax TaxID=13658 RepID=A0A915JX77_ROMCU